VFTTNGITLRQEVCQKLTEDRYSVLVSLHSSHPDLHEQLTGLKTFDKITAQIRSLAVLRKGDKTKPHINLVFLMTAMNIENLPSFVAYARGIGADMVSCSYLTIFEPHQIKMSTFFMKEKTNEMMDRAKEEAEKNGITLCLPPKYVKHEVKNSGSVTCHDPWEFFYVEMQGSINPCCYAGDHIGHLERQPFEDIWNGQGYTELREGLISGKIHNWCKFCCKYDPNNVNDIRSHITFRPETREKILNYIKEHKNEFPSIAQETELQAY
jgi:MoaA/NifB/PqqE/SkfB family radical SAM enzyme